MARGKEPCGGVVAWLVAPLLLLAVLGGVFIVMKRPLGIFGTVLAFLFAVPLGWILVSALWPAHADRTCPECDADALERLDPRTTHGVRCRACGWVDETRSAWLLAEEEGPLEQIVLEQRRRRRNARPELTDSPVDSSAGSD